MYLGARRAKSRRLGARRDAAGGARKRGHSPSGDEELRAQCLIADIPNPYRPIDGICIGWRPSDISAMVRTAVGPARRYLFATIDRGRVGLLPDVGASYASGRVCRAGTGLYPAPDRRASEMRGCLHWACTLPSRRSFRCDSRQGCSGEAPDAVLSRSCPRPGAPPLTPARHDRPGLR